MFNPPNARSYFETVWDIVCQIPAGKVSAYGQIASMIPPQVGADWANWKRLAPRWVGTALRKSPRGKSIPWHRVINSQGKISFPSDSPQANTQRRLLEAEGVAFDQRGKVDFAIVAWQGPDDAYLTEKSLLPPRPLR